MGCLEWLERYSMKIMLHVQLPSYLSSELTYFNESISPVGGGLESHMKRGWGVA